MLFMPIARSFLSEFQATKFAFMGLNPGVSDQVSSQIA
jgi:hypothetical protein